jgi:hypothetical protein
MEIHIGFWWRDLKAGDYFEDLGIDEDNIEIDLE